MSTTIICPNCRNEFEPQAAIAEVIAREFDEKLLLEKNKLSNEFQKLQTILEKERKEFEEKKKIENDLFADRLQKEKVKLQTEIQEQMTKSIAGEFENKMKLLQDSNRNNEEKLRIARQTEIEFLKKEQAIKDKEANLELQLHKMLQEERTLITERIRKQELEKNSLKENELHMKLKEYEKQLEDQKKLVNQMRRKADQVSMQLQGEVQELALEDLLKSAFPFDLITEVAKGKRGADCIQTIRNQMGQECGHIIYESKRTQNFSIDWIEKLKSDMRTLKADIAVLVTATMPKDMDCFGLKDGVWVCCFEEARALAGVLRDGVIRVYNSSRSHENKGDKINMLYNYLISNEFSEKWKAMREGFLVISHSIQKERDIMEKMWASRKKQLERILYNSNDIKGSIEGIAGHENIDFTLLENEDDQLNN